MADLPIRKLPGVGKVNEMILGGLEIYTCRDLLDKAAEIYINFTERAFDFLVRSALGLGKNEHEKYDAIKKSMSVCYSFKPINNEAEIRQKLEQLIIDITEKCNSERLEGRTLTFEFKNSKFVITQRSVTKSKFIGRDAEEIRSCSERLFKKVDAAK
jgi:DNA polymerase kappa